MYVFLQILGQHLQTFLLMNMISNAHRLPRPRRDFIHGTLTLPICITIRDLLQIRNLQVSKLIRGIDTNAMRRGIQIALIYILLQIFHVTIIIMRS